MIYAKQVVRPALITGLLLLVPLIAMQLTHEVTWTLGDFVVASTLLFGTGLAYEVVVSRGGHLLYRLALGLALGTALLLVWSNLAVGIIGSENNPANVMYLVALGVGFAGALAKRFQPHGMAKVLVATAGTQALVTVIALLLSPHWLGAKSVKVAEVLSINTFFILLWLGAALLFARAGSSQQ